MFGSRALTIVWGDTDYYWRWINKPESSLSIDTFGGQSSKKNVCLNPNAENLAIYYNDEQIRKMYERMQGLPLPNVRSDGWLEIEMGNFFIYGVIQYK
ncbi:hypothetical protein Lal_00000155 [Lupinus albus]|nr:hypothetical protein Lal_00000155 [Lupinus albus]